MNRRDVCVGGFLLLMWPRTFAAADERGVARYANWVKFTESHRAELSNHFATSEFPAAAEYALGRRRPKNAAEKATWDREYSALVSGGIAALRNAERSYREGKRRIQVPPECAAFDRDYAAALAVEIRQGMAAVSAIQRGDAASSAGFLKSGIQEAGPGFDRAKASIEALYLALYGSKSYKPPRISRATESYLAELQKITP